MIEAVAFDFDGVLVGIDTHTKARLQAFEEFAQSTGDKRFIASDELHEEAHLHGSHPPAIIGWVLQQQGLVKPNIDPSEDPLTLAVVSRKTELYHDMVSDGLDATEGAVECVHWAAKAFTPDRVAIVTTASLVEVNPFLKRYDLTDTVGVIITKEDVEGNLKPHPMAYDLAAQRFDAAPANCAAIEDSSRGLQSAKSASFVTFGISTTHTAEQLGDNADYTVATFTEIPQIISSYD